MRCRKVRALLSEYLEGDLRGRRAESLHEHLAACADCKRELVRLRSALGSLARTGAAMRPAPDLDNLHRRIAAAEARRPVPRWRWAYAVAPAASLLVAVTLWLTISGNRLELSPDTIAYTWALPTDVPWPADRAVPTPVPPPAVRPAVARRVRVPAPVARLPKREVVALSYRNEPPPPVAPTRPAGYDVSLIRPGGGTVSMSSRAHTLASGEPTKVYINYEGPAGSAGSGTSDESGTTL
jgi:hypothetical protein